MSHFAGGHGSAVVRAQQLIQLRRYVEARDLASAELAAVPFDADLHEQLASAHGGLEEWDKALDAIEQSLSLTPADPYRHGFRAMALSLLGRHGEARAGFEHALELDPENSFTHMAQVEAVLRDPAVDNKLDRPRLLALARRSCDTMLRVSPELDVSHLMHAKLLIAQKNFTDAKTAAERAIAANPNNPIAHQLRGIAQQQLGQIREAGDSYVAAGKIDPSSSTSGDLLEGLGKAAAPLGLGAFLLFRLVARAGSRGAEAGGVPPALILILVIGAMVAFFAVQRGRSRQTNSERLSPQAQAALKAREKSQ